MKKNIFRILILLVLFSIFISAFVACEEKDGVNLNISFISNDEVISNAMTIEEAKAMLASQPEMEGYIFMGWYLDKDTWTQKVDAEDVESYINNGNFNVYAYWVEKTDTVVITFYDYNNAVLLEREFNRDNVDLSFLKASQKPDDDKYTYTFSGWECDMSDITLSQYKATPKYTAKLRSFDVEYYVEGFLYYTEKVVYGENANPDVLEEPSKTGTLEYEYVFAGWEGNTQNITQDTRLDAKFEQITRKYDVTFYFGNANKSTYTVEVEYGQSAKAPTAEQVKRDSSAKYDYTFTGWDQNIEYIVSDLEVHALYTETIRSYTVNFYLDNEIIKSQIVEYEGSAIAPENVIKPADKVNTYEFIGWDNDNFDEVLGDMDIHAQFQATPILYTVTFLDWDDSLLGSVEVEYGQSAVYEGIPVRESSDMYDYVFTGWTNADKIACVESNITVKAEYSCTIRTFDVVFNYGDNLTDTQKVEYGKSAIAPQDTSKASTASTSFEFIGWDNAFDYVTSNLIVNAVYREDIRSFEVKFMVDDECIKSDWILYGESAVAPDTVVKVEEDGFTYEFIGWDKTFDSITENTVVNAQFKQIAHTYTIQYVNWDGTVLFTDYVESGQASVYPEENGTPTRKPNDMHTYVFEGWTNSDDLANVTHSFVTYAQYQEIIRTYTVTFIFGHNQEVVIDGVPYGTDLTDNSNEFGKQVPTNVEKASTAQYDFTFIDWNKYFGYVSQDMTIEAIYKETIRKYVITFINDGTTVKTQEVAYGQCPTAPELSAYKQDNVQYKYTYLGWGIVDGSTSNDYVENRDDFVAIDVNATAIEGELTYTAIYLREIQQYTVQFYNEIADGEYELAKEVVVDYGTDVTAMAPEVSKPSTVKYEYTFTGWDKAEEIKFVNANINVYAQYSSAIRKYAVTFMNGDEVYAQYMVEYGTASPIPEVDPTKQSTAQYDFVFIGWVGGTSYIEGDTTITADYRNDLRYYKVTFFNLATSELIETVELGYGSTITKIIERENYYFDSWYKDPYCNTVFDMNNETVDGTLTLFGNIVMEGLVFNENNEITGYTGSNPNLVIPIAANGKKVTTIKEAAFKENAVIETVYIPSNISSVEAYVFSKLKLKIYVQSEKKWTGTPDGWNQYWNRDSLTSWNSDDRPVTYGVDGLYSIGDYEYILHSDGYAIINTFINNTTNRAYIDANVTHNKPSFTLTQETDEKTGIVRDIYELSYTEKSYNVTTINSRAFQGCKNLSSIFIPNTIDTIYDYAFSGVSANIYIQKDKPLVESTAWGVTNIHWNDNEDGDEGTRILYWGVVGMDEVGDFAYIFKNDNTAIAAEYLATGILNTSAEVPSTVTYNDVVYTVTELGGELFANQSTLNTVVLNEGLKKIGEKAFYFDIALNSITLPSTLEEIGAYAFVGTMGLKEIYIPASVNNIGTLCFAGSSATLYLGIESKPLIGFGLYWNVKIGFEEISNLTDLGALIDMAINAEELPTYYNVKYIYTVEAKETGRSTTFKYILYNDNNARLIGYDGGLTLNVENYSIPSTIEYNGEVFNVVSIGANALNGAGVKNLFIPASVTYIEANGLAGCAGMTVNTAHTSKPGEWVDGFNPDNCTINYQVASA